MPLPDIGRYGAVGFELVASIGAGFFIGRAVDQHYATNGAAMWIGFFLGVLSGFLLLARAARALEADASRDDSTSNASASARAPEAAPPSADDRLKKKLEAVERDIDDDEKRST